MKGADLTIHAFAPDGAPSPGAARALTPYRRTWALKEVGAVGDGATDDTAAIEAAVASGLPLHWGDASDTYRTSSTIAASLTRPLLWRGEGATIQLDASAPLQSAVNIAANGHNVDIQGVTVDANRVAHIALYLRNQGEVANLRLTDVKVMRAYRSSQAFAGGDGIWARGAWGTVTMDRPVVCDISMKAEAAIPSSQGITGITVSSFTGYAPGTVTIISPMIEGVESEDKETYMDQDAIRVMPANYDSTISAPLETQVLISGGQIRNCGGRALKSQVAWCTILGTKIYRDLQRATVAREIDFQKGGGSVIGVNVHYKNCASESLVCFEGGQQEGVSMPRGSVDGLSVVIEGDGAQSEIIKVRNMKGINNKFIGRNIELRGGTLDYIMRLDGGSGSTQAVMMSDVIAEPRKAAIVAYYAHAWDGDALLSNLFNRGPNVPLLERSAGNSANITFHTSNTVGYTAP